MLGCGHTFCSECFNGYFYAYVHDKTGQIQQFCPIQKKSNDQIYKIDEVEVEDYEGGSKNPEKKEKLEKINGFRA